MSRSFLGVVLLVPLSLYAMVLILPDFLKYLSYRIKNKGIQNKVGVGENEEPVLVLEYNNKRGLSKVKAAAMFGLFLCMFGLCIADNAAREDSRMAFFSLDKDQTYILYYWTWKFISLFLMVIFFLASIKGFNKRVLFFKDRVISENGLVGTRELALDNSIMLTKNKKYKVCWIYDRNGRSIRVFDKRFMNLESHQEKLLDEILCKIPEKKKNLFI
jgi:hypothetical protein